MIHWTKTLGLLLVVAGVVAALGGGLFGGGVLPFGIHW